MKLALSREDGSQRTFHGGNAKQRLALARAVRLGGASRSAAAGLQQKGDGI